MEFLLAKPTPHNNVGFSMFNKERDISFARKIEPLIGLQSSSG
jgi:hypothetical protein